MVILGTPANCSGTDRDRGRLVVSQEAEPLQGGAVQPTSAITIYLQSGVYGVFIMTWTVCRKHHFTASKTFTQQNIYFHVFEPDT